MDPTTRFEITDLIHRFALSIDHRDWTMFRECMTGEISVQLDESIGGSDPTPKSADEWVKNARSFFEALDATHHHVTVYQVEQTSEAVEVLSYFRAGHFKKMFVGGSTFDQVGNYRHRCVDSSDGWRIAGWVQTITYTEGNTKLLAMGGDGLKEN